MFTPLDVFKIWTTNIDIDDSLVPKIIDLSNTTPTTGRSGIGSWQGDILPEHLWATPIVNQVCRLVDLQWPGLSLTRSWFNVNTNGTYNKWHIHGTMDKVVVVYINTPDNSGNIQFRQTNKGLKEHFIIPHKGLVVAFPGMLEHRVESNESTDPRISLAINFKRAKTAV